MGGKGRTKISKTEFDNICNGSSAQVETQTSAWRLYRKRGHTNVAT